MSDYLQSHGLQHSRLSCPSPTPRAYSNSCPSSHWCHPTISSSVGSFSSHVQSFPASGSFPISQLIVSSGQNIGVSLNLSPPNEFLGLISFRINWLDLLAVQGTLKSLLQHSSKASILPSSWWCHPTIPSSVVPFSSWLQSFPASGSFQMSQFFASSGQTIGVSGSTLVLPMNIQDWFPLG